MKFNRMHIIAVSAALFGTLVTSAPAFAATPSWYWNWSYYMPTIQTSAPIQQQTTAPVQQQSTAPAQSAGLTAQEQQILDLVNDARTKAGLKPLVADAAMTNVARLKSSDMVAKNYFDHQSPTYGSPFDMLQKFGIRYMTAGENIAENPSIQGAFQAWMNSPGHRANILNPNYTKTGIGIAGSGYGLMFTQEFVG